MFKLTKIAMNKVMGVANSHLKCLLCFKVLSFILLLAQIVKAKFLL